MEEPKRICLFYWTMDDVMQMSIETVRMSKLNVDFSKRRVRRGERDSETREPCNTVAQSINREKKELASVDLINF